MKKYFWAILLCCSTIMVASNSAAEDLVILDGYLKPAAISIDTKKINVEVEFAVRSDLAKAQPLVVEWVMIGKPTINLTNPTFTFGPHRVVVKKTSKSTELHESLGQAYVTTPAILSFDGLVSGRQLPDDRYMVAFHATLLSSRGSQKLAKTEMPGQILAVLLNAGSKKERLERVTTMSSLMNSEVNSDNSFQLQRIENDSVGYTHAYYDQYYKGVRVFGAKRIHHVDDVTGRLKRVTDGAKLDMDINTTAGLTVDEALDVANRDMNPKGQYSKTRSSELVIYKTKTDSRLVFHVHSELLNAIDEPSIMEHFIDAQTGVIIEKWPSLHSVPVTGTGRTRWYGNQIINTNSITGGYRLEDRTKASAPYNRVYYLTPNPLNPGTYIENAYIDSDNTWGDSSNYSSANGPASENGKTVAADVAYGIQESYDYFKSIWDHRGQDDTNSAVRAIVHHPNMNSPALGGLGVIFFKQNVTPAVTVDIVGHEYTHGVTEVFPDWNNVGESYALNEGTSDILGTMIEFKKASRGDWTMCEQLSSVACINQRLDKPSLTGDGSLDYWVPNLGTAYTQHQGSGPLRHFFYYLINGVPTTGYNTSPYLPAGNPAIGNTASGSRRIAAEIWYQALRFEMTHDVNYNGARIASINAAITLGYNFQRVGKAWMAVNVNRPDLAEPPCSGGECTPTVP